MQRNRRKNSTPYTGEFGGSQVLPATWIIRLPKNDITLMVLRQPGIYFIDNDPSSLWLDSQFVPQGDPGQNTNKGCYLSIEVTRRGC